MQKVLKLYLLTLLLPYALKAQDSLTMPGHVVTGDAATAITTTTTGMPDVVVTDEGITVNGTEVAVTSTTGGCSVTDTGGTLYAADDNGRVTEVGKMPEETVGLAEYRATAAAWNKLDASNKVHFANDDDLWAFDQYNEKYKDAAAFATAYEDLDGYRVPWKLVPAGKWGKVTATLTGSVPKPDSVVFRTPRGTVYHARRSGRNYSLTIVSGQEHDVQEVYALYPAADSGFISLGKLCVATYPMQTRRLTIVPVAGADAPGADNTAEKLNDIYRPYGIEWTVKVEDNWNNTSWDVTTADGLVEADGVALFSSYTDEMKALIAAYRASHTVEVESPYIFVVPGFRNSNSTLLGDMPLSLQFGFVAEGANRDMVHTIAHELGHGVYQLWHTFSSRYSLEQESTSNLMDYTVGGAELIKKQWDLVHDPASIMLAWAVDEEEGEMAITDYVTVIWTKTYTTPQSFKSKKGLSYIKTGKMKGSDPTNSIFYKLTDGSIIREYDQNYEIKSYYEIVFAGSKDPIPLYLSQLANESLSDDLAYIAKTIQETSSKVISRYILPLEDGYILFEGEDLDGVESSRVVAGVFLLIEIVPGGKLLKPAIKGLKAGTKATVKGSRKIYMLVKGTNMAVGEFADDVLRPAKWIEGEADEVLETLSDVTYIGKDGKQANGTVQIVKKGNEVGFRIYLSEIIKNLAEANLKYNGKTVLGHFPDYITKAKSLDASYYDIGDAWNSISDIERWAANQHFLDKIAENGDQVLLSIEKSNIIPGSYLEMEISYLVNEKGYKWINQWSLKR